MKEFKKLEAEKGGLETEIKGLQEYLTSDGMPGLSGGLIDEEGFPRADLDIYAIRKARNRVACAQTDHVAVMKKLEQLLFQIHAGSNVAVPRQAARAAAGTTPSDEPMEGLELGTAADMEMPPLPFAWIDEVTEGSPACEAGLQVGDDLCRFGGIDRQATGDLNACFTAIAQLVPQSVNAEVDVLVLRGRPPARVELKLTPKQWAGRGLLGCHLAPKTG